MADTMLMRFSWVYGCWLREAIGVRIANGIRARNTSIELFSKIFYPHGLSDFFNWQQSQEGYVFWHHERNKNHFRANKILNLIDSPKKSYSFIGNRPYLELYFV